MDGGVAETCQLFNYFRHRLLSKLNSFAISAGLTYTRPSDGNNTFYIVLLPLPLAPAGNIESWLDFLSFCRAYYTKKRRRGGIRRARAEAKAGGLNGLGHSRQPTTDSRRLGCDNRQPTTGSRKRQPTGRWSSVVPFAAVGRRLSVVGCRSSHSQLSQELAIIHAP